jgi:hypothetical protein
LWPSGVGRSECGLPFEDACGKLVAAMERGQDILKRPFPGKVKS